MVNFVPKKFDLEKEKSEISVNTLAQGEQKKVISYEYLPQFPNIVAAAP